MPDNQSTSSGAVFLSYASQDAESARRICEALRASGLTVWFDQSELRGGDAWDQSIRRQIKNCALFVPVISAHTQTRLEGYFRLEWKLAEDRSHLMARGKPFIVPVTVDATSDHEAHVPDAFLAVQWTKLPGGDTPAAFGERLRRLLGGPESEPVRENAPPSGPSRPTGRSRDTPGWLIPAIAAAAVCAGIAVWRPWRAAEKAPQPVQSVPAAEAPPAPTPAGVQELVSKAWAQLNKTELGPDELEIADGFCKRATELDPSNAEAWAAWSQVGSWYVYDNYDSSKERQEAARQCAARALQLAPGSYEARLAQACYLVRGATVGTGRGEVSTFAPEALQLLHQLLKEKKGEPRALFALAILQRNMGRSEEARASFMRLSTHPRFAATAWSELAWMEYEKNAYTEIEAPLARSLAIQPFWGNLGLKVIMEVTWQGDLKAARAALERLPATVLQSDFGAHLAFELLNYERKPDEWLKFSRGIRRDWIHSNGSSGPIAAYNGLAQQMAGRNEAARLEWQAALKLVENSLADQPADAGLLRWKGELLIYLGNTSEAGKALDQAAELSGSRPLYLDIKLRTAEGQLDSAIGLIESDRNYTAAELRLDPGFDPLRGAARFKALLARAEDDPKRAPQLAKDKVATVPNPVSQN